MITFCLSFLTTTEHTKVISRGFDNFMTKNYPRKETGRECDLATNMDRVTYPLSQPRA